MRCSIKIQVKTGQRGMCEVCDPDAWVAFYDESLFMWT